jgi:hypothetical protein
MRAIFLILIVAVLALIAAVALGLVNLNLTRPATAPSVESVDGKIVARPGQAPAFDVETGSIGVGTSKTGIAVPKVEIQPSETRIGIPAIEVRRPGAQAPAAAPAPVPATQANTTQR